jgi:hypothetical protein
MFRFLIFGQTMRRLNCVCESLFAARRGAACAVVGKEIDAIQQMALFAATPRASRRTDNAGRRAASAGLLLSQWDEMAVSSPGWLLSGSGYS